MPHDQVSSLPPRPSTNIIYPEDVLPLPESIGLGFQHVIAMFGSTVLAPILMGFDPNVAVFFSGIATLIFFVGLGGRVPSYLGSSFSFIAAVGAATAYTHVGINPHISVALGGIIAAGFLYSFIGLIVWFFGANIIEKAFPGILTGAIVAIIGLNLAKVAVNEISGSIFDIIFGLFTIALVSIISTYLPRRWVRFSLLIGSVLSYIIYFILTNGFGLGHPIDYSAVQASGIFGLPSFTYPTFDLTAITLIGPVAVVLVAENLGHVRAVGSMCHRNMDPYLGRAFFFDGLATMISASMGGTGVTTYAENIGVMSMTKNFSSRSLVFSGFFAIFLGLSPKFGAVIHTIPLPVLGGLSFILFGMITATAGRIWREQNVDFSSTSNALVVGVALIMGAGDLTIRIGSFAFGGITTATLAAVFLYHLLNRRHLSETSET